MSNVPNSDLRDAHMIGSIGRAEAFAQRRRTPTSNKDKLGCAPPKVSGRRQGRLRAPRRELHGAERNLGDASPLCVAVRR